MKSFAWVMSALYVLAGCSLLFTNALIAYIPHYRVAFGLLLVGYGIIRFYMWWKKNTQQAGNE